MIVFTCPCGKQMQAKEEYVGRTTQCPACGRRLTIPGPSEAIEPARDPAAPLQPAQEARPARFAEEYEAGPDFRQAKTSGKAVASLVLGIASFLCSLLAAIPAIILAILALVDISKSRGRLQGQGLAIGGIVTGALGMLCVVPVMIGLLLPAVQKVREAANRMKSQNNLKQLALAMYNYHDAHGRFPPAVVHGRDGEPLYSWRVLLLPYLGEQPLYSQFKLDEPWAGPNNRQLLARMPKVFAIPAEQPGGDPSLTFYQVFVGPHTAFEGPKGETMRSFTDGTSNTILIVEAADAVPWTKPADLPYGPDQPLPRLGGHSVNGFNAAMADGAVRFLPSNLDERTLRAAITRNGGEQVLLPK